VVSSKNTSSWRARFVSLAVLGASVLALPVQSQTRQDAPLPASWVTLKQRLGLAVDAQAWDEVFQQLDGYETELAGVPEFDRLFGVAAARSGHTTRAVMALERVLDHDPNDQVVRAELASLHFRGGENRLAREMLESLLVTNSRDSLPSDAANRIDHFLRALDERQRSLKEGWSGWTSLSYGFDTNVSAGTRLKTVELPALPGIAFTPGASLQAISSSVRKTQVGARWLGERFGGEVGWGDCVPQFEASAQFNDALRASEFSQHIWGVDVGWSCPQEGRQREWNWTFSGNQAYQGGQHLRDSAGFRANHSWYRGDSSMWQVTAQSTVMRYLQDSLRNGRRDSVQMGWIGKLGEEEAWLTGFAMSLTQEMPTVSERAYQGYRGSGLQTYARYHLSRNWSVLGLVNYESRSYGGQDVLYLNERKDHDTLYSLALNYRVNDGHQLSLSVSRQINDSNQALYGYERRIYLLNWRLALGQ
jgi:hypothetical protein